MDLEQQRAGFIDGAFLSSMLPCPSQRAWAAVERLTDAVNNSGANSAYLLGLEAAIDYRDALRENPSSLRDDEPSRNVGSTALACSVGSE